MELLELFKSIVVSSQLCYLLMGKARVTLSLDTALSLSHVWHVFWLKGYFSDGSPAWFRGWLSVHGYGQRLPPVSPSLSADLSGCTVG